MEDYRSAIIRLLKHISDQSSLRRIYKLVVYLYEKED